MPRPKSRARKLLLDAAMLQFWQYGYTSSSIQSLVSTTRVSRHGIYEDFGDKHGLFMACLGNYQSEVVSPAFVAVESPQADMKSIANYFEFQIARAESLGLPGPGCLIANSATEVAPHDAAVQTKVDAHRQRLDAGFLNALSRENAQGGVLNAAELSGLAGFLTISAQGLWTYSRTVEHGEPLRRYVATLIQLIENRMR